MFVKGLDLGSVPTELSLYQHTRESVTFTVWFQYTGHCILENQSTIYLYSKVVNLEEKKINEVYDILFYNYDYI